MEEITKDFIEHWINYDGGVFKTDDNHFGGVPNIQSKMNLNLQQRPNELAACIDFLLNLKKQGETMEYFAEIGAASGGTTFTMNKFLNFKEILVVDENGENTTYSFLWEERRKNLSGLNVKEVIGDSGSPDIINEALEYAKDKKFDLVFIDGLHTYEYVKKDTINYMPLLREGGYLLFHDVNLPFIEQWMIEMTQVYPNIEKVGRFSFASQYTHQFSRYTNSNQQDGIGLELYKVN
jgi:predicted O-methyltransferase YrrM